MENSSDFHLSILICKLYEETLKWKNYREIPKIPFDRRNKMSSAYINPNFTLVQNAFGSQGTWKLKTPASPPKSPSPLWPMKKWRLSYPVALYPLMWWECLPMEVKSMRERLMRAYNHQLTFKVSNEL